MTHIRLVPASVASLEAFLRHPNELSAMIDSPVPDGWPEFPEAIPHTLSVLKRDPAHSEWWMYFFIEERSRQLVGSGGFAGPPEDGVVEIGYEIAPAFRRLGHATAATEALVQLAVRTGVVDEVIAHTLPVDEGSPGVLRAAGFQRSEVIHDPEHGEIIRWRRKLL